MRKRRNMYVPITIEAQQPNGDWWTRNALKDDNDLAKGGEISRERLIEIAYRRLSNWNCNYDNRMPLRVGGIERPEVVSAEDVARLILPDPAEAEGPTEATRDPSFN